jgi:hypothetical protein
VGNGGTQSGTGGSFAGNGGSVGTGGSGGTGGSPGTGGTSSGSGGTANPGTGGNAGTGGVMPPRDGGTGGSIGGPDAGGGCRNTDMTQVNLDSTGRVCNNQWGIQGAWYCYTAPGTTVTTASGAPACTPNVSGIIPFNSTSNAMCISGTSAGGNTGADFGAALGFELNNLVPDPTRKQAFNATMKNVVGFAITVTGTTGGSALNINFPQLPQLFASGKAAAVTVPGPTGASMTYNVLLSQAMVGDNTVEANGVFPPPTFNPAALTDVQVALPGGDGIRHDFNYCVTKVVPLMAAAAAPTGNFGALVHEGKQIFLQVPGSPYAVQNDPFVVGQNDAVDLQVTAGAGGTLGFSVVPRFTGGGGVLAYPSVLLGWVQGGYFAGAGVPGAYTTTKTISALTSVTSDWSFTPANDGTNYDAAYDIWFANATNALSAGFEFMVWLNERGVNPIGGAGTAIPDVGGRSYRVATGTNPTGQPVISYVMVNPVNTVTGLNLLELFRDAVANNRLGGLGNNTSLLSIHAGFELYGGSSTWTTTSFRASAQ